MIEQAQSKQNSSISNSRNSVLGLPGKQPSHPLFSGAPLNRQQRRSLLTTVLTKMSVISPPASVCDKKSATTAHPIRFQEKRKFNSTTLLSGSCPHLHNPCRKFCKDCLRRMTDQEERMKEENTDETKDNVLEDEREGDWMENDDDDDLDDDHAHYDYKCPILEEEEDEEEDEVVCAVDEYTEIVDEDDEEDEDEDDFDECKEESDRINALHSRKEPKDEEDYYSNECVQNDDSDDDPCNLKSPDPYGVCKCPKKATHEDVCPGCKEDPIELQEECPYLSKKELKAICKKYKGYDLNPPLSSVPVDKSETGCDESRLPKKELSDRNSSTSKTHDMTKQTEQDQKSLMRESKLEVKSERKDIGENVKARTVQEKNHDFKNKTTDALDEKCWKLTEKNETRADSKNVKSKDSFKSTQHKQIEILNDDAEDTTYCDWSYDEKRTINVESNMKSSSQKSDELGDEIVKEPNTNTNTEDKMHPKIIKEKSSTVKDEKEENTKCWELVAGKRDDAKDNTHDTASCKPSQEEHKQDSVESGRMSTERKVECSIYNICIIICPDMQPDEKENSGKVNCKQSEDNIQRDKNEITESNVKLDNDSEFDSNRKTEDIDVCQCPESDESKDPKECPGDDLRDWETNDGCHVYKEGDLGNCCDYSFYDEMYGGDGIHGNDTSEKYQWYASGQMPHKSSTHGSPNIGNRFVFDNHYEGKYAKWQFHESTKEQEYWNGNHSKDAGETKSRRLGSVYFSQYWYKKHLSQKTKDLKSMGDLSHDARSYPNKRRSRGKKSSRNSMYFEAKPMAYGDATGVNKEGSPLYFETSEANLNSNQNNDATDDNETIASVEEIQEEEITDLENVEDNSVNGLEEMTSENVAQSSSEEDASVSTSAKDPTQVKYSEYGHDSLSDENLYFESQPDSNKQISFHAVPEEVYFDHSSVTRYQSNTLIRQEEDAFPLQPTVLSEVVPSANSSNVSVGLNQDSSQVDIFLRTMVSPHVTTCENIQNVEHASSKPEPTVEEHTDRQEPLTFFERCKQTFGSLARRAAQVDSDFGIETEEDVASSESVSPPHAINDTHQVSVKYEDQTRLKLFQIPDEDRDENPTLLCGDSTNPKRIASSRECCDSSSEISEVLRLKGTIPECYEFGSSVDAKHVNENVKSNVEYHETNSSSSKFSTSEKGNEKRVELEKGFIENNQDEYFHSYLSAPNHVKKQLSSIDKTTVNKQIRSKCSRMIDIPKTSVFNDTSSFHNDLHHQLVPVPVSFQSSAPVGSHIAGSIHRIGSSCDFYDGTLLDGIKRHYSDDIRSRVVSGERHRNQDTGSLSPENYYSSMYERSPKSTDLVQFSGVLNTMSHIDSSDTPNLGGPTLLSQTAQNPKQYSIGKIRNEEQYTSSRDFKSRGRWQKRPNSCSCHRKSTECSKSVSKVTRNDDRVREVELLWSGCPKSKMVHNESGSEEPGKTRSSTFNAIGTVGKELFKGFWFFGSKSGISGLFSATKEPETGSDDSQSQLADQKSEKSNSSSHPKFMAKPSVKPSSKLPIQADPTRRLQNSSLHFVRNKEIHDTPSPKLRPSKESNHFKLPSESVRRKPAGGENTSFFTSFQESNQKKQKAEQGLQKHVFLSTKTNSKSGEDAHTQPNSSLACQSSIPTLLKPKTKKTYPVKIVSNSNLESSHDMSNTPSAIEIGNENGYINSLNKIVPTIVSHNRRQSDPHSRSAALPFKSITAPNTEYEKSYKTNVSKSKANGEMINKIKSSPNVKPTTLSTNSFEPKNTPYSQFRKPQNSKARAVSSFFGKSYITEGLSRSRLNEERAKRNEKDSALSNSPSPANKVSVYTKTVPSVDPLGSISVHPERPSIMHQNKCGDHDKHSQSPPITISLRPTITQSNESVQQLSKPKLSERNQSQKGKYAIQSKQNEMKKHNNNLESSFPVSPQTVNHKDQIKREQNVNIANTLRQGSKTKVKSVRSTSSALNKSSRAKSFVDVKNTKAGPRSESPKIMAFGKRPKDERPSSPFKISSKSQSKSKLIRSLGAVTEPKPNLQPASPKPVLSKTQNKAARTASIGGVRESKSIPRPASPTSASSKSLTSETKADLVGEDNLIDLDISKLVLSTRSSKNTFASYRVKNAPKDVEFVSQPKFHSSETQLNKKHQDLVDVIQSRTKPRFGPLSPKNVNLEKQGVGTLIKSNLLILGSSKVHARSASPEKEPLQTQNRIKRQRSPAGVVVSDEKKRSVSRASSSTKLESNGRSTTAISPLPLSETTGQQESHTQRSPSKIFNANMWSGKRKPVFNANMWSGQRKRLASSSDMWSGTPKKQAPDSFLRFETPTPVVSHTQNLTQLNLKNHEDLERTTITPHSRGLSASPKQSSSQNLTSESRRHTAASSTNSEECLEKDTVDYVATPALGASKTRNAEKKLSHVFKNLQPKLQNFPAVKKTKHITHPQDAKNVEKMMYKGKVRKAASNSNQYNHSSARKAGSTRRSTRKRSPSASDATSSVGKSSSKSRLIDGRYAMRRGMGSSTNIVNDEQLKANKVKQEEFRMRRRKVGSQTKKKNSPQNLMNVEVVKMGSVGGFKKDPNTGTGAKGGLAFKIEHSDDPERPLIRKLISSPLSDLPKKNKGSKKLYKTYVEKNNSKLEGGMVASDNRAISENLWSGNRKKKSIERAPSSSSSSAKIKHQANVTFKRITQNAYPNVPQQLKKSNWHEFSSSIPRNGPVSSNQVDERISSDRPEQLFRQRQVPPVRDDDKSFPRPLYGPNGFTDYYSRYSDKFPSKMKSIRDNSLRGPDTIDKKSVWAQQSMSERIINNKSNDFVTTNTSALYTSGARKVQAADIQFEGQTGYREYRNIVEMFTAEEKDKTPHSTQTNIIPIERTTSASSLVNEKYPRYHGNKTGVSSTKDQKQGLVVSFVNCLNPFKLAAYRRQQVQSSNKNANNNCDDSTFSFSERSATKSSNLDMFLQKARNKRRNRDTGNVFRRYKYGFPDIYDIDDPSSIESHGDADYKKRTYRTCLKKKMYGSNDEMECTQKSLNTSRSRTCLFDRLDNTLDAGDDVLSILHKLLEWNIIVLLVNLIAVSSIFCPGATAKVFACPLPRVCNYLQRNNLAPQPNGASRWENMSPTGEAEKVKGGVFYSVTKELITAAIRSVVFCVKTFLVPAFLILFGFLRSLLNAIMLFLQDLAGTIFELFFDSRFSSRQTPQSNLLTTEVAEIETVVDDEADAAFSPSSVDGISSDLHNLRNHGSFFFYFGFDSPKEGCDFSYTSAIWKMLTGSYPTECL